MTNKNMKHQNIQALQATQALSAIPDLNISEWNIICDFDGTITPFDVTDAVLAEFALPVWEEVEEEWLRGGITARECMERQIALIRAPQRTLDAFLDNVPVTEGFPEFMAFCKKRNGKALVVSDGMDYAIKRVLSNHGMRDIPVIANRLLHTGGDRYKLEFPYGAASCPSGVCKCAVARSLGGKSLLIGDGRSDCCLSGVAAFTMARRGKELLRHCLEKGHPHVEYDDFFDILTHFDASAKCDDAGRERHYAAACSS